MDKSEILGKRGKTFGRSHSLFVFIALSAVLLSCGGGGKGDIPVLDVTKSYPTKNIVLQDIADVEYLPLETKEGFLLSSPWWHYMDDEIMVTTNRNDIMIFDRRTGRGITSFNRAGRGPGEYQSVGQIAVDRKNNEMFVSQIGISGRIHAINAYDMEGKHIRTLEFYDLGYPGYFHVYDDDHLFMRRSSKETPAPFKLMSRTDTVLTDLPLRFEGRDDMTVSMTTSSGSRGSASREGTTLAKVAEGNYMISEPGIDTIYNWNTASGKLTPVMTRVPSFRSMEYPTGVFAEWQSRDYIGLETIERKFEFEISGGNINVRMTGNNGFKTVKLFYDKTDGEFYEGKLLNGDIDDESRAGLGLSGGSLNLPAGLYTSSLQPYILKELYEEGKLRGKLAELAPRLKDEDNPIAVIVTLK